MGWFSNKPKPCKHKNSRTVAYDPGYSTTVTDRDNEKINHHVEFVECAECGGNRCIAVKGAEILRSMAERHSSIINAKHKWIENRQLQLTDDANIYAEGYITDSPSNWKVKIYKYEPVTEIDKIINLLKQSNEFTQLRKHQMVEDAFGELVTVVKMHENLPIPGDT